MFQGCSHRKSQGDPHLLCNRCCEQLGAHICTPQLTCDVCEDLIIDAWERIFSARVKHQTHNVKKSEAAESHSMLNLPCSPDPLLGQEEEGPQEDVDVGLYPPPPPLIDPPKWARYSIHSSPTPLSIRRTRMTARLLPSPIPRRVWTGTRSRPPRKLAREIKFSELLKWIHDRTAFELGEPSFGPHVVTS